MVTAAVATTKAKILKRKTNGFIFIYFDAGFTSVISSSLFCFCSSKFFHPFQKKLSIILYVIFNTLSHLIILKIDCHINDSLFMIVNLIQRLK